MAFFLLFPFYWGFISSLKFEVEIYDFSGNFTDILTGYWPLAENIVNPSVKPCFPFKHKA